MPKKSSKLQFTNYHKQLQAPFEIFVGFLSNLKQVQNPKRDNADASYTGKYREHIACSYGYKVVCIDD